MTTQTGRHTAQTRTSPEPGRGIEICGYLHTDTHNNNFFIAFFLEKNTQNGFFGDFSETLLALKTGPMGV